MNERRNAERPSKRMPIQVFAPGESHPRVAYAHDLTRGGVRLEFFEGLPQSWHLTVELPSHRRLRAMVRWIIDGGPLGRRLMGCEFSPIQR